MKQFYLILFTFLSNITVSFAQDTTNVKASIPSDNSPDHPIINYSFTDTDKNYLKFDKILPFDKEFTIHFTGIPANVTFIGVKVLKYNTSNINTKKPGTFSQDDLRPGKFEFDLRKWTRPAGNKSILTGDIIEIIRLLPNTDYQIAVETGAERNLSVDEQNTLRNTLLQNVAIASSIDILARSILSTQLAPPAIIKQDQAAIVSLITQGVAEINPSYKFKAPAELKITAQIQTFNDQLRAVLFSLNNLKEPINPSLLPQLKLVTGEILSANYGTISDANVSAFCEGLRAIVTKDNGLSNPKHQMVEDYTKIIIDTLPKIKSAKEALIYLFVNNITLPNTYYYETQAPTYSSNFAKSSQLYVTLDVGYAYVSRIDRGLSYSGVNIYLRPIDRGVPLNHYSGWDSFGTRASILIGLSMGSVAQKNVRKGLIGDQALVLGIGYRIVSFFKFNAGCFVHYRYDKDPVITPDRYYTSLSPFVSFSIDFDVQSLFSGIGNSLLK